LAMPVINETGITGKVKCELKLEPKNLESINNALRGLGFAIERGNRPVETVIVTGGTAATSNSAPAVEKSSKKP
jgi:hypothetical protein